MYALVSRASRTFAAVAFVVLTVNASVLIASDVEAVEETCRVVNLTTGSGPGANLQRLINTANAADVLQVEGRCLGTFTIDRDLTIVGKATQELPTPTLDGDRVSTVLSILGAADRVLTVSLTDLTITHGAAEGGGGGILSWYSAVTLDGSSAVTANTAKKGGGILSRRGRLTLSDSASVSGNYAIQSGGGIQSAAYRVLALNDSASVTGNVAGRRGGGVFTHGTVSMSGTSLVGGNRANAGGGIDNFHGHVTLSDSSSVSGNTAQGHGGGIFNDGVVTLNGTSTVRENTAISSGGGIYNNLGVVTLNGLFTVTANVPDDCVGC